MFSERKQKELEQLSPAALEEQRKQKSLNRIFGLLLIIALILLAMFIYEMVLLGR